MNRKAIMASGLGLLLAATAAHAADFSYTADGGLIPQIPAGGTQGFANFPLFMTGLHETPAGVPVITSIELVLNGLTHTQPDDLDIYLISPIGETVEVMTDKGDGIAIVNMNLVFNDDLGASLPADGLALTAGTYDPEDATGGLSKYIGNSGGTDAWELVIIDDSTTDQGSLTSYTLRGTYTIIPEPASLALLGFGALAALRRSRRAF
jgi:hypothetical protein